MNIKEVIDLSILAIFSDKILAETLVLKGGSAIRLMENIDTRLSIDVDFSINASIKNEGLFFKKIDNALTKLFKKHQLEAFDFQFQKKPERIKEDTPIWWSGWNYTFKLIPFEFKNLSLEKKRIKALIPEGSNSPTIKIDISEYEYCLLKKSKKIKGITVQGYTKTLLVLEKIRALCQQHKTYKFSRDTTTSRARDFYDIAQLTQNVSDNFLKDCRKNIKNVFTAKEVPLEILKIFWDDTEFIESQRKGFNQVESTVSGKIQPFKTYLEHLRSLIQEIHPPFV